MFYFINLLWVISSQNFFLECKNLLEIIIINWCNTYYLTHSWGKRDRPILFPKGKIVDIMNPTGSRTQISNSQPISIIPSAHQSLCHLAYLSSQPPRYSPWILGSAYHLPHSVKSWCWNVFLRKNSMTTKDLTKSIKTIG